MGAIQQSVNQLLGIGTLAIAGLNKSLGTRNTLKRQVIEATEGMRTEQGVGYLNCTAQDKAEALAGIDTSSIIGKNQEFKVLERIRRGSILITEDPRQLPERDARGRFISRRQKTQEAVLRTKDAFDANIAVRDRQAQFLDVIGRETKPDV